MKTRSTDLNSPLGRLRIDLCCGGKIRSLMICAANEPSLLLANSRKEPGLLSAEQQLVDYFQGRLQTFDLPIDFSDYSPFAVKILQTLQTIPFGTTISYGQLAALSGHAGAARAVGRVVGANRTPLLIPCHRVIGSRGDLVGYSATGGLLTKSWLLRFEEQNLEKGGEGVRC